MTGSGRVAVAEAPARVVHPTRHVPPGRGARRAAGCRALERQVHNFGTPAALAADRFIVCGRHARRELVVVPSPPARHPPPGDDLYYLNVMAGPDPEGIWQISDDPAHGWVRA